MKKNSRIFVAGHRGLVGSAIWKSLENKGYSYLIGRTHKELDLEDPAAVREFFDRFRRYSYLLFLQFEVYIPRK